MGLFLRMQALDSGVCDALLITARKGSTIRTTGTMSSSFGNSLQVVDSFAGAHGAEAVEIFKGTYSPDLATVGGLIRWIHDIHEDNP